MDRCKERNLKLNRSKIKFKQNSVKFLGHVVTSERVKPDPEKIQAIQDMKTPENIK